MTLKGISYKKYYFLIIFLFLKNLSSCGYTKTDITLGSAFDSTWSFSESSNYDFDSNLVEVINGRAQLKALDLETSGDDFFNGALVGSYIESDNQVTVLSQFSQETDLRNILPLRANDLLGYWKFEGNFEDSSINTFNMIAQGDASADAFGKVGHNSLSLDGNGDYLYVDYDSQLDIGAQFSIAGWVRLPAPPAHLDSVISRGYTIGPPYYVPYYVDFRSNQLCGGTHNSLNTDPEVVCGSLDFSTHLNQWVHFVFVKNEGNYKIYLNGVLDNEVNGAVNANLPSLEGLAIGNLQNALTRDSQMEADELAIWTQALSSDEVKKIFELQNIEFKELSSSWTPKWDRIIGYWKMDGNWLDSSSEGHHAVPLNDPEFIFSPKVGSSAGSFDGVSDNLSVALSPFFSATAERISFSGWFYIDPLFFDGANAYLLDTSSGNPVVNNGFSLTLEDRGGGVPTNGFTFSLKTTMGTKSVHSQNNLFEIKSWYHLSGAYNGTDLDIYVNGVKVNSTVSGLGGSYVPRSAALGIGKLSHASAGLFQGAIDDLSLFSVALDSSEMHLIYNRQKQKYSSHFDSEVINLGSSTSVWPDLSWDTNLPFGKELVGDYNKDGNSDVESLSNYLGLIGDLNNGLIGSWKFNELVENSLSGGLDFEDTSILSNSAIESGGVVFNQLGKLGRSIYLDGTNDLINLNSAIPTIEGYNNGTISMWFRTGNTGAQTLFNLSEAAVNNHEVLMGVGPWTTDFVDESAFFALKRSNIRRIRFFVREGHEKYLDGEWHHMVVRIDGLDNTIFIDGIKKNVTFTDGSLTTNEFTRLTTGETAQLGARSRFGATSNYFNGNIDEFSIWNRALSNEEVQQLYRRGANRIKLQVKSCVDLTCACESFNTSPQGDATDCDGDGTPNELDASDSFKSKFIGPGGDGTTYYSELYNRPTSDVTFSCALNTTDSNAGVCVEDEINFSGSNKPTGPEFLNADYTQFIKPPANQYAQYRVYMEADDNTACNGEPCLPELTAVSLNPQGDIKYSSNYILVKPKSPITVSKILSAKVEAEACVSFRISRSNTEYYFNGTSWVLATLEGHRNTAKVLEDNMVTFVADQGEGLLGVNAYLKSDGTQSLQCSVDSIDVKYN